MAVEDGDWLCGRLDCCGVASWLGDGIDIADGAPGIGAGPGADAVGVGAEAMACGVEPGIGLLAGRLFSGENASIPLGLESSFDPGSPRGTAPLMIGVPLDKGIWPPGTGDGIDGL